MGDSQALGLHREEALQKDRGGEASGSYGGAVSGVFATPDQRKRADAVREVALSIARSADFARRYSVNHPSVKAESSSISEKLKAIIDAWGDLMLTVAPDGLLLDDKPAAGAANSKRLEVISKPLFEEGVRQINILAQAPPGELTQLVAALIAGAVAARATEGVATKFWEAEFTGVRLVVVDTFEGSDEVPQESLSAADARRPKSFRAQVEALIASIADPNAGMVVINTVKDGVKVSLEEAALLNAEGVRDITVDALERQDVSRLKVEAVEDAALRAYAAEMERDRVDVELNFARALTNAAVLAQAADRTKLVALFARFAENLALEGRFGLALKAYQKLVEGAKLGDGLLGPIRIEVLKQFKATLISPSLVEKLISALEDESTAPEASAALRTMGKSVATYLTAALPKAKSPGARAAMLDLLNVDASPSALAAQVKVLDVVGVAAVFEKLAAMKLEDQLEVLAPALASTDVNLRRLAVSKLDRALALRLTKAQLLQRLSDSDAQVRAVMIRLATEIESPSAPPPLIQLLKRASVTTDERKLIYEALAAIADPSAQPVLLEELDRQTDVETRIACAEALAAFPTAQVKTALEQLAAKVLVNAKLRQTAKDVVTRFERGKQARQNQKTEASRAPALAKPEGAKVEPAKPDAAKGEKEKKPT